MANHYISQSGAGTQDGSSAANARAVSWLNTSGNWSGIAAGDFIRLVGTIASPITVYGSGTSGNVITIMFETGAKLSAAGLHGSWITIIARDYITIDGGATGIIGGPNGNLSLANGIIENTDNGTALGSQVNTSGIFARGCRHLTVKNLVIRNIFVRADDEEQSNHSNGLFLDDDNNRGINNHLITNCHVSHTRNGIFWQAGPSSEDLAATHCTVTNINWGIALGCSGSGVGGNRWTVAYCLVNDFINWDTPPSIDRYHHDGIYIFAQEGATWGEANIHSNVVGPDFTMEASGGGRATAGMFFTGSVVGPINIFNNVFLNTETYGPSDGAIFINSRSDSTFRVMNNTFIGGNETVQFAMDTLDAGGPIAVLSQNNIFVASSIAMSSLWNGGITLTSNHNLGHNLLASPFKWAAGGSGSGINLAAWQTATSQDGDWTTADPLLTSTYRLGAGSPAIGAGENLSAFFSTDADGNARPAEGAWDIGAYQFDEIPVPLAGPRAPARRLISGIFF